MPKLKALYKLFKTQLSFKCAITRVHIVSQLETEIQTISLDRVNYCAYFSRTYCEPLAGGSPHMGGWSTNNSLNSVHKQAANSVARVSR